MKRFSFPNQGSYCLFPGRKQLSAESGDRDEGKPMILELLRLMKAFCASCRGASLATP